ncbi:plasmid recombination protein [Elizabethkingia ursingii]|uniref:plasmid recombination protein n=1 Tax=Elizabethkingia ursingii TaxID=1756150 RepID=UPI002012E826|nr:plasmid recombination protein [Elizabethkingia ursingii]MCL1666705.1 plasmid recombination protein [Elizabethkingia ursingii]
MKTSINFKVAKPDSEIHNFRKKTFDYIRKDLSSKNEYWQKEKIADRLIKIENYCKEKSGRKLQKNAMPIREAVVVIKEDTTMLELQNLASKLQEELKIRIFQIAIHKDEGHYDKETKEWKPNYHAHLVADWQDLETGKTLKHQSFHYSKMQDIAAECLEMERGISGSIRRLEAVAFKIQKKEEEYKELVEKIDELKSTLKSQKSENLIVEKTNFLGFKKIVANETIENYKKAIKIYNTELLKNGKEKEVLIKNIAALENKNKGLNAEIMVLKKKNIALITSAEVHVAEKEKYYNSIKNILEKTILSERSKNPNKDRSDKTAVLNEMQDICYRLSTANNIAVTVFNEIFSSSETNGQFFVLLRSGSYDGNDYSETNNIEMKKKRKKGRRI